MKRISLIVLGLLLLCNTLNGQNTYTVFKVTPDVQCQNPYSKEWVPLHRHDTLKLSNRLLIPADGQVSVLESGTGLIYKGFVGTHSLKEIIDDSKRSVAGAVARQLKAESAGKLSKHKKSVYGATSRGKDDKMASCEQDLAQNIMSGKYKDLSVHISSPDQDGMCHLIVTNAAKKAQTINIVAISTQSARVLIPSEDGDAAYIIAHPGEQELECINVYADSGVAYKAFPVSGFFDASALARYLVSQ